MLPPGVVGMTYRILVAHNAYKFLGGEDRVVESEIELLRDRGHEVFEYRRHNDEIDSMSAIRAASDTLWSTRTHAEVSETIKRLGIDLVHVHNTFPLISPSLYWAAASVKVPVVQTLHNFRLHCPQGMYLREGKVCEDCIGRLPLPAIRHRCYRESTAQTTVLTAMLVMHRVIGTWQSKVDCYIALNEFCRDKFIQGGLPADRIRIKPNFVDFPESAEGERKGFLYVGRLSEEKGIDCLLRAAAELPVGALSVCGTGPKEALVRAANHVRYLGSVGQDVIRDEMASASALVIPSVWYENFPRTLVEAFASGVPVIASRIGALATIIEDGVTGMLFEPGNDADLKRCLLWCSAHPEKLREMGRMAREAYERSYTPEQNYLSLIDIYHHTISRRAEKNTLSGQGG